MRRAFSGLRVKLWSGRGGSHLVGPFQCPAFVDADRALAHHAVFSCMSLVAGDIGKLRIKKVAKAGRIWVEGPADAVLRKPNLYQNRIQFVESWILSKLQSGNAYILKEYGAGGGVVGLHVLDAARVIPKVSTDGEVFYHVKSDALAGVGADVTIPAADVIHDRYNCLFHPLVGLSRLYAAALGATQGMEMQKSSADLFANAAMPAGVLATPGDLDAEDAGLIRDQWQAAYGGSNRGKVAVLGNDLKFQSIAVTATDAQLVEQMKWSAEVVCGVFHVPAYKIGVGVMPNVANSAALNADYFSRVLQRLIEAVELCLDDPRHSQPFDAGRLCWGIGVVAR
ncbi:phage portal protein [Paracoccus cavernae]|uniref:Phage portal protein n=1 Tax=Paracoccus cavernae TaxID=1571207 RepID=A0ABT8D381_9RHOB|nr:phage portal protein [Paracoccus cavernae]